MQSVLAVLAGFVVMTVIVIVSTVVLARGMTPPAIGRGGGMPRPGSGYLMANLGCSALAALVGGYLTASMAESAPVLHGVALAVLMIFMSALSMRQSMGTQPRWYAVVLMTVMPAIAVGGSVLQALLAGSL
jgi:hypothetical protein